MFNRLKKSPLKRAPFKKHNQEEIDEMRAFFISLWNKRPHYCTICGKWLGNEPLSYFFDHILEKSKYPELKYEEKNISFLCLDCHDCKTKGFFPETYNLLIQKTKKLFNIL